MGKILSHAGETLADTYDVEGSSIGIEQLETRDVSLVHEMGATIFSERIASTIHTPDVGAIAQSTTFNNRYTFIPNVVTRLVGISVCTTTAEASRIDHIQISIETLSGETITAEIPIWMWNDTDGDLSVARWSQEGAAAASFTFLRPFVPGYLPQTLVGIAAHFSGSMIEIRGKTTAFGAGTVTPLVQLHTLFSTLRADGLGRTFGLPIPSW